MRRMGMGLCLLLTGVGLARAGEVSLDRCVREALRSNPDARIASARVEEASAAYEQARSAFYPQVSVSGSYGRTDNAGQALFMSLNRRAMSFESDVNNPPDTENYRGALGAKWLLFDGGRRELGVGMARVGGEASEAMKDAVVNELAYAVVRGYYGALQARAFLKVQEEQVQSLAESLRVAGERVKAGGAVQTDVLNLEVRLAEAREDQIRAKNGLRLAVAALNTAIGQDLVTEEALTDVRPPEVAPAVEAPGPGAEEGRAELRAARLNISTREKGLSMARRAFLPRLSAFGESDWDSESGNHFEQSYLVGAMVELDVFSGFRGLGEVKAGRAALETARAGEQKARDNLRLDLTVARIQLDEARERQEVSSKAVKSAEEALRITRERYQQGAADVTDLLTAQVGLTATRTRGVAALYDFRVAQENLARAAGRLGPRYEATAAVDRKD